MVVLECPYDHMENEATRELFSKVIALKIAGYKPHYDYGVLPVDTTDYVGTHLLICTTKDGELIPVTGCRTITLARSERHGLTFPGLGLVQASRAPEHVLTVQEWVAEARKTNSPLSYASSWTVSPDVPQESKSQRSLLRSLFEAIHVFHHTENQLNRIIVGGTLRFKTDHVFKAWGHEPLSLNGKVLGPIQVPTLLDEDVAVMTMTRFNEETLQRVERWRGMWNRRITLSADTVDRTLRRVA